MSYMIHLDAASWRGLNADRHAPKYNAHLNLTVQAYIHLNRKYCYNQGRAKMTHLGFSILWVPCLAMSLLCNNSSMQTTTLGHEVDENQCFLVRLIICFKKKEYKLDFKQSWHWNITYILKYVWQLIPNDKFVHIFGFSSVKNMLPKDEMKYFPEIETHLKALGKFASSFRGD